MKAERLGCGTVREELSARLDGEHSHELVSTVDAHMKECAACRRFERAIASVHRQMRVQPAMDVPDLTNEILERVAAAPRAKNSLRPFLRTALASGLAAALLVGLLGLPNRSRDTDVATASQVITQIRDAARHLSEYGATFAVTERGWHPDIPVRTFDVSVLYAAPESLKVQKRDLTDYPTRAWSPSNETMITNDSKSFVRRSLPCPPPRLSNCSAPSEPLTRVTINRQPFEGTSPTVTDIVLPLESLASSDGVEVVGTGEQILGRNTLRVRLPYWQGHILAEAVLPSSGRTFDPASTVDLWLDSGSWFPLRFTVTEPEQATSALEVTATSVTDRGIEGSEFSIRTDKEEATDSRFMSGPVESPLPSYLAGLRAHRSGTTPDGHSIATFARGLAWLTVVESEESNVPRSLLYANAVHLPRVGAAYYEPATSDQARILEVFDGRRHIHVESNLPRETLLSVAASIPVEGILVDRLKVGETIIERIDASDALALDFFKRPQDIPAGYEPTNATITREGSRVTSVVLRFTDPQSEFIGGGIVVTAILDEERLAPSAEPFTTYDVHGTKARWSSLRGELEWVDGTTYRSVRVADFRADFAVEIARSM